MSDITTYHRGQRNFGTGYDMIDQIETLEAKLAKAVDLLRRHCDPWGMNDFDAATLAEIKGENHD